MTILEYLGRSFSSVLWTTGIVAGLCVLAFPVWIMGIPGIDNDYAKGWKMGLTIIFVYPFLWLLNSAVYFLNRGHLDNASLQSWRSVTASVATLLLLLAVARMIQAFKTMSSKK